MRKFARLCLTGVAIACSAILLSGCAKPDPVVTPAPASSSKPLFATDADALAAATKAYAAYLRMSDQILHDGGSNPERLETVETGKLLEADQKALLQVHDRGIRGAGVTKFDDVKLQQHERDQNDGNVLVVVYLCEDVTEADLTDSTGVSIVSPDRQTRTVYQVTFETPSKSGPLLVSDKEKWRDSAC
jgi:hypothetical protein